MKKRLNIISMLVLLTFGMLIGQNMYKGINSFIEGFTQGTKQVPGESIKMDGYLAFDVKPVKYTVYPDTLYNKKSDTKVSYRSSSVEVKMESSKKMEKYTIWSIFPSLFIFALGIIMIIRFVRLINTINNSIIFDRINIKRLRFIGIGFIIFFLVNAIMEYFYVQSLKEIIEFDNYKISGINIIHTLSLVLGLVSLLVAEIFAIGLKLKEEQELTI
ncbi:hypothetical protein M2459_002965 [Parabacteroides sp. PF5-5]|uniref:DUF2975 domain-containing protein n=1 Tax=unclassified Parabacteroides TaxID=2649774 RepID=UPI0024757C6A|nr:MULTISPECIES: DUF2975 domain-containing protein [unclassified Parabacteroides]MDH6305954.1 hypothetical protein [Parabacteroides sp. PH5-39]MDH6317210.1 hypothetical protein [Parabacteroides sp. PF5-13]MDH6320666.1 hypothetical protein [Parabacteroides sp. PH5-13]MDH6324413.1 hypothetical protein [Parabacteroides sp. PH5-8]MDH6328395.1 hypothetical protein [Parabacteroides sp. PH5-41]